MGEEERLGWACPRCPPIVWGGNWDDKKNHATTLDNYGGIFFHTITNQKHVTTVVDVRERTCDREGAQGVLMNPFFR